MYPSRKGFLNLLFFHGLARPGRKKGLGERHFTASVGLGLPKTSSRR
jgi:hypothetical protein